MSTGNGAFKPIKQRVDVNDILGKAQEAASQEEAEKQRQLSIQRSMEAENRQRAENRAALIRALSPLEGELQKVERNDPDNFDRRLGLLERMIEIAGDDPDNADIKQSIQSRKSKLEKHAEAVRAHKERDKRIIEEREAAAKEIYRKHGLLVGGTAMNEIREILLSKFTPEDTDKIAGVMLYAGMTAGQRLLLGGQANSSDYIKGKREMLKSMGVTDPFI